MEQWSGKVALVTGAAGGIGSAVTESLVKSGMKVVGCDRNMDNLTALAEKLNNEDGELHTVYCDLRQEEDILCMFEEIKQKYGAMDVCINVAGYYTAASCINGETQHWKHLYEVNVLAMSICTREAIKSMKERNIAGQIIHISSTVAHFKFPVSESSVYIATKHAVKSLTESLRTELRQEKSKIRISSVSPGQVQTKLLRDYMGEEKFNELANEEGNFLLPEDVASTVAYILSCPPRVQVHDIILRGVLFEY